MLRLVLSVVVLFATVGTASAQHCRGVRIQSQQTYVAPAYVAPTYYQPVYNTYTYLPVAVYAVPGNPTVALNIYPGTMVLIQQAPPVNVTVNVDGKRTEVQVVPEK